MNADTLAIINNNNQTLWTRAATAPLTEAAVALRALQAQTSEKLQLIRSFVDRDGSETLVEYLTAAAEVATPDMRCATVEVWHRNPPDFFYAKGKPVDKVAYIPVAHFTWPAPHADTERLEPLLDATYGSSQNIDSAWNPPKPCRSTSVGDVLVLRQGDHRAAYAVASVGFSRVDF